jgi:rare lipoprotein A
MLRSIFSGLLISALGVVGLATQPAQAAACTEASHYGVGDGFHGAKTASGERFNAYALTAAHKTLPFGAKIRVVNQINGKSVIVRVNDDGPHVYGRSLDLSYGAFAKIASPSSGVASVCYSRI